ncbi:5-oxoprolinase subunit PxpB [Pedobacter metabolipauper]|uniref:Inhibitor of KinA n=1 Tax=Pedobacter metabolipauper TaxID=425513 RepID=A0A4R6SZA7_9SPHI|nr:5-oxoprolinase subunit PxpB [Pedobacter metabolipauper]TDQ11365.1 inhibitor of KinA [Pedobacter metabolipauper]
MIPKINSADYQCFPLGDSAIVLEFGREISVSINTRIRLICEWLDEYTFEGFVDYVPAFTTITVYYEPWVINYDKLEEMLDEMISGIGEEDEITARSPIEIPVLYGGHYGPDLDVVARQCQLTTAEVIRIHHAAEYLVYMIGFAPGFPYLGGMDERIATPRKETPRALIPAGSVGIAGKQTGIYPIETPGGWQIIGQTPLQLFNIDREVPALLKAGDRIRFISVTEQEFIQIKKENGH